MKKRIFIGAAWPYANGSLHPGHAAALLGADIIARYHRLCGDEVLFVSGSDCHGTPIAVEADCQGIHPSEIAKKYHQEFIETLINGLKFSYDIYTETTTKNHQRVVQEIFSALYRKSYIYKKTEELPYCSKCQRFLADRYIEGECPICRFSNARGDQCDKCGTLFNPSQLLNPQCKICGHQPEWKPSEHFFLRLSVFHDQLKELVKKSKDWRINAKNFTLNLLKETLPDRAITRDIKWGIPIPLPNYEDKRIYVWFEAVCGYLSASKEWAQLKGNKDLWEKFWIDKSAIHYYVHGKDNIPFHTIIWPTILLEYGKLHLPDRIISSEFLTLEGKQFSKSRKWAIWLPDFLKQFDAETLRYYLVVNGPETGDANFSWSDYQVKVNSELIGHFGNFIHRAFSFVKSNFPNGINLPDASSDKEKEFLQLTRKSFSLVGSAIKKGQFREGLHTIFRLTEYGNRYLQETSPWTRIKNNRLEAEKSLATAVHVIRNLAVLIEPYLPITSERIRQMVHIKLPLKWKYLNPDSFTVSNPQPLYKKIELSEINRQQRQLGI